MATRQMSWRHLPINVVFAMIGVPYNELTGEYGLAWQALSWGVAAPVLLTGLWARLVLLGRMFGWGLTGSLPDSAPVVSREEVPARNGNHGAAENGQEAAERGEADPDDLGALASWLPHPDDPSPAEASRTPKVEEKPAPGPSPAAPQPVSTEVRTRPRPSRRRRRLRG
jgi:hypothetical protein